MEGIRTFNGRLSCTVLLKNQLSYMAKYQIWHRVFKLKKKKEKEANTRKLGSDL